MLCPVGTIIIFHYKKTFECSFLLSLTNSFLRGDFSLTGFLLHGGSRFPECLAVCGVDTAKSALLLVNEYFQTPKNVFEL